MQILLDTHIALWAIADTKKLSNEVIEILESKDNEVFYSVVSAWEIAIKYKIKPETMPMSEEEFVKLCEYTGFVQLPIEAKHIFLLKTLVRQEGSPKHNDPFDRMLLAQAKCEELKFITHGSLIPYYEEDCIIHI